MSKKANVMRMTNALLEALENVWDEELADEVCVAISSNEPFSEEMIAAADMELDR